MKQVLAKLKAAHKSVMLWFNSVMATGTLAIPYLADSFPALHDYLPANIYKFSMTVLVIGNMIIHFRPTARKDDTPKEGEPK